MAYIMEVELIQNPPPTTFDTSAVKNREGEERQNRTDRSPTGATEDASAVN